MTRYIDEEKGIDCDLEEISKGRLADYIPKAAQNGAAHAFRMGRSEEGNRHHEFGSKQNTENAKTFKKSFRERHNREKGIERAASKLMKEDVEKPEEKTLQEISAERLTDYIRNASFDKSHHAHKVGEINGIAQTVGTNKEERAERSHHSEKHGKRSGGIQRAVEKLLKKVKKD